MTDPDELGRAVGPIADALDAIGVRWAIGGSIASAVHGEPRATNDVDVVAALDESQARDLCARLGAAYHADADMAADAVRRRSSFNVIDTRSFIKIDVFVPPAGALGLGQLDRRLEAEVVPGARAVFVLGAEDTVLQKLRWYQLGGGVSDRQWRDIVSVLRHTGRRLDDAYLDSVANDAKLGDLLATARADASAK
jgi:hypothetical protein